MSRDALDRYYTPKWATEILLRCLDAEYSDSIYEPCSGKLDIAKVLYKAGFEKLVTNDIDPATVAHFHNDAIDFLQESQHSDWIITNPPFSEASRILKVSYEIARKGIAFLLRLSWLEPCQDRADFLKENPPTKLIVLPRISFTGDGKVDSVTCSWMVWYKPEFLYQLYEDNHNDPHEIIVVSR